MSWITLALDAAAPQRWRNGGGTTRELLAWPTPGNWRVRMSVADVEVAGPFSRFDGVERWFAVLEGTGVVLRIGGREHPVLPGGDALQFDGSVPVDCALLDGPTRDFNLMAPPAQARMQRVRGELTWRAGAGTLLALYAHREPARLEVDAGALEVPPFHLAWCVQQSPLTGAAHGRDALWMEASA
jgi:uncharacterized protein